MSFRRKAVEMPVGLRLVRHAVGILFLALATNAAVAERPGATPLLRSNEPLSVKDILDRGRRNRAR